MANDDDERTGAAVDYGLITTVIAVALISALITFRREIAGMFTRAGKRIDAAT